MMWPRPTKPIAISERELEVLIAIADGLINKEVAYALKCSEQTVKNHITNINKKLGTTDRTSAVVYAIRAGWVK